MVAVKTRVTMGIEEMSSSGEERTAIIESVQNVMVVSVVVYAPRSAGKVQRTNRRKS